MELRHGDSIMQDLGRGESHRHTDHPSVASGALPGSQPSSLLARARHSKLLLAAGRKAPLQATSGHPPGPQSLAPPALRLILFPGAWRSHAHLCSNILF